MAQDELSLLSRFPAAPRRRLTVDDYHRMGETGILTDDDRVELIEGELVAMAPIGSEHAAAANMLNRLLVMAVGERGIVAVGNPLRLNNLSEPQPDFAILKPRDGYSRMLPRPEDTIVVVEVANTSLAFDRRVKVPLYAQAGIPEVWIVDLPAQVIDVHRSPVNGAYTSVTRIDRSGVLTVEALTDIAIPAERIFAG